MKPSIKILGGRYKNRTLSFALTPSVRPTSHRLRETIFDILVHCFFQDRIGHSEPFENLRVLDLFAGTGAYGFEALSRGAREVFFIDQSAEALQHIQKSAALLQANVSVHSIAACLPVIPPLPQAIDLVFLDPPYHWPEPQLHKLFHYLKQPWLQPEALLILEVPLEKAHSVFENYEIEIIKKYKNNAVLFIRNKK